MNQLGPDALALLDAARDAHDPTPADKARVKLLVAASIAALPAAAEAASSASAPASAAATAGSGLAVKIGAAVLVTAGLATALYTIRSATPEQDPVTPPAATAPVAQGAATEAADAPADVDVSTLAEQAGLLAQVRVALRDGDHAAVLTHVDAYDARFPQGMLREEALAARALALCGLDRKDEAKTVAETLRVLAPRSVHLARIDAACE
ncbi:MAG: hypothetical protein RIT81_18850 [Deltaproteobacteria bacterium]